MNRKFKIDGQVAPYPVQGMKYSLEDISDEDTGRTLDGTMDKNIVAQKVNLACEWKCMNDTMSSKLLKLAKANTFVELTYPDPVQGKDTTKTFYTGTPSVTFLFCQNNVCFWDISFNFIEK